MPNFHSLRPMHTQVHTMIWRNIVCFFCISDRGYTNSPFNLFRLIDLYCQISILKIIAQYTIISHFMTIQRQYNVVTETRGLSDQEPSYNFTCNVIVTQLTPLSIFLLGVQGILPLNRMIHDPEELYNFLNWLRVYWEHAQVWV